ncbi:putative acetyltransferase [Isoptericola sp. CG 20/1183]|uniref:Acetyltransferase n=1 Tax=Isoptericola halotolerans TaxID=300560 RepID=A0ABX5EDU1_9MICO|nr:MULTISPECIES: GNAT family N-acetyltransferase [Isoptericola]MCK0115446.1 GNAT family N-acetyltransferase [Isoptericola sp. S6320L]PRZ04481.1 putative acetyltransferase [Isoptericola halotolerans]PRZ04621.1 putative acetyltransferase [Isoptericola sp. CG 20/1183]
MKITQETPAAPDVRALLDEHLADMFATSPPESVHALDHAALLAPSVTFLTARDADGTLLGCGALSELPSPGPGATGHGELKSMRTARAARGRGVATAVLDRLLGLAAERGYTRVSLETGPQDYFAAARRLYARHGFVGCGPFGSYVEDPHSVFMTLAPVAPAQGRDRARAAAS